MRWKLLLPLVLGLGLGWPAAGWTHGARIDYRTQEAIEIQALYDTGEPLADAQVTIYAPEDPASAWLTGTTDAQGRFWFRPDPDQPGNWEVTVRQSGHGDILVIPTEEVDLETVGEPGSAAEATLTGSSAAALTPLQKGVMVGSILWGCVGTALFFSRSRS